MTERVLRQFLLPPCCYSYSECVFGPEPSYRQMTLYILGMLAHCNSYLEGHTRTLGHKHASPGKKSSRLLRIAQATPGRYVAGTSMCPCLPGDCGVFFLPPAPAWSKRCQTLCVGCFFFFLGTGLFLPSKVRQSGDSKPCLTTASVHGPSCF